MTIYFYKQYGELGYLANYSDHGFELDNKYWPTVEHYYQAQKFDDEELKEKIRLAETPKMASAIGRDRNNKLRANWEEVKRDIMLVGVLAKFRSHQDILKKLIDTGDEDIVENTDIDYYWGCGTNKTGRNEFGKILVKAREILKKEIE